MEKTERLIGKEIYGVAWISLSGGIYFPGMSLRVLISLVILLEMMRVMLVVPMRSLAGSSMPVMKYQDLYDCTSIPKSEIFR